MLPESDLSPTTPPANRSNYPPPFKRGGELFSPVRRAPTHYFLTSKTNGKSQLKTAKPLKIGPCAHFLATWEGGRPLTVNLAFFRIASKKKRPRKKKTVAPLSKRPLFPFFSKKPFFLIVAEKPSFPLFKTAFVVDGGSRALHCRVSPESAVPKNGHFEYLEVTPV